MKKAIKVILILLIMAFALQTPAFALDDNPIANGKYYIDPDNVLSDQQKATINKYGSQLWKDHNSGLIIVPGKTATIGEMTEKYQNAETYYKWFGKGNEKSYVMFFNYLNGNMPGHIGDELYESKEFNDAVDNGEFPAIAQNILSSNYGEAALAVYIKNATLIDAFYDGNIKYYLPDEEDSIVDDNNAGANPKTEKTGKTVFWVILIVGGLFFLLLWQMGMSNFATEPSEDSEPTEVPELELDFQLKEVDPLRSGLKYYRSKIEETVAQIEDLDVSKLCTLIAKRLEFIEDDIEKDPNDRAKIKKLTNHILPMIEELIVKYEELEEQRGTIAGVEESLQNINQALEKVDNALRELLDDLFINDSMEISANIETLDSLLTTKESSIRIDFDKLEQ